MCTAYELGKRGGSFPEWLVAESAEYLFALNSIRIIRPTHKAPVILPDGSLREMSWGFRRQLRGKGGKPVIRTIVNSREDKLRGHTWRYSFNERRCLIPAFSFYEWVERPGGMAPLRFTDAEDRMIWIAGIWEKDSERGEVFSMITTEPSNAIAPIHDRMPAVLEDRQFRPFLNFEFDEIGPSSVPLKWREAENFLKSSKKEEPPGQAELF